MCFVSVERHARFPNERDTNFGAIQYRTADPVTVASGAVCVCGTIYHKH